jgi:RNA polymerase sigma-70 factor (ECF subfamily)
MDGVGVAAAPTSTADAAGERALLARARRGDGEAFASLVRRYDAMLRALAFRLLDDRQRMDDVLQEAYVKAFRALPRFRGESSVATWLYRIVYNACGDELRRLRRTPDERPLEEADASLGADPAERLSGAGGLAGALARLTPEDRAVVLLVDAFGASYDEAAVALGVPRGTVASRLSRARPALRRALEGGTG